jgi:hypothetical protein
MSRGPQLFKQTDVEKAIKAAIKAGATDWRVEIVNGKIVISSAAGGEQYDSVDERKPSEWD